MESGGRLLAGSIRNRVACFRYGNPFRRQIMAVLYYDESAMQPRSQLLFDGPGHGGRRFTSPDHDDMLIALQIIPASADDQFFAIS